MTTAVQRWSLVAGLAVSAGLLAAVLLPGGSEPSGDSTGEIAMRTVRVSAVPDDSISESARSLRAWRVRGAMPGGPTMATVSTDEDCAPDQEGISRCLNELRLDDGGALVVRHPHSMHQVPCMSPGERIRVVPG